MRDMNPANKQNWKIACGACGQQWDDTETVELVGGHFQQDHPDIDHPHFTLVWVGVGPKPKGGPRLAKPKQRTRRR